MPAPLPDGYVERRTADLHVVAREGALDFVLEGVGLAGSLYEYALLRAHTVLRGGRAGVAVIAGPDGGEWAVRHYWRGGAVARFLGDRYLRSGTPRPLRELELNAALRAAGVETPALVAAVVQTTGAWYRGDVATVMIPRTADLAALTLGPDRWAPAEREAAWHVAGGLLRRFFRTGAVHADLNLRNLIVQRDTGTTHLLDLDRCELHERVRPGRVAAMLARFHRSRRKLEQASGAAVGAAELAAFERGLDPS